MALHYLGYLLKLGNNLTVKRTPFKIDTYIGACTVAEYLRIDIIA